MGIHAYVWIISIVCTLQPEQRAQGQDPQGKKLSEGAVAEELRVE